MPTMRPSSQPSQVLSATFGAPFGSGVPAGAAAKASQLATSGEVKRCAVQGQSGVMHGAAVGFNGGDVGAAGLDEGEHFLRTC